MSGTRVPLVLALLAASTCSKQPANDTSVYSALVACGALGYYDGGPTEVAQTEADLAAAHKAGNKPWLDCLYAGGSPLACNAPCTR